MNMERVMTSHRIKSAVFGAASLTALTLGIASSANAEEPAIATVEKAQTETRTPVAPQENAPAQAEVNQNGAIDKKYVVGLGALSILGGGLLGDALGRRGIDKYGIAMEVAAAGLTTYVAATQFYTESNINSGHHAYAIIIPALASGVVGALDSHSRVRH